MNTSHDFVKGYPPKVAVTPGNPEALKYGKLWDMPEYRVVAPGESTSQEFLRQAKPRPGATVIDFGCGTGRGGLMLAILGQMNGTMIDFTRNCLDDMVREACEQNPNTFRFVKADLEKLIPAVAEYGFCSDVMEHIPPDKVDTVLNNILKAAQHTFFSISTVDDSCGELIGEKLHLSVHPYQWWLEKFKARGCMIHHSSESDGWCNFYVSAWSTGQDVVDHGVLNTGEETILANVKYNTKGAWKQVMPHETNDFEVMILGGGPSLADFKDDIIKKRAEGVKLITLNGSYNWALNNGLTPSAQVIVDARPFNARFTKPVVKDCVYLISSQCDPSVLEGLPSEKTYLWHTSATAIDPVLKEAYKDTPYWVIAGGSTVLLRAIPLMRVLGYKKFHLYGVDSCLVGEAASARRHHAYSQPENDSEFVLPVIVNPSGRIFHCHPWMASQATEFLNLIRMMGNEIDLAIYGDGLLAHILEAGAELASVNTIELT